MTVEVPSPNQAPLKKGKVAENHRMYLPAVYRYSCQGFFSATSVERGSPGHCRGVRSRIEHLLDMNPSTREDAIKNFTGEGADVDEDDTVGLIEDGSANPALIYPADVPLQINPVTGKREEANSEWGTSATIIRETWKAFGSTEIECLQLTDLKTGQSEIVAVSPYNAALVSTRKIEMVDRNVSSTELGIGPYKMQFLIESGVLPGDREKKPASEQGQDEKDKDMTRATNEVPDTAIIPSYDNAKQFYTGSYEFLGEMYTFSGQIVQRMNTNAQWLYGNLQDDFPARTAASARRIVDQMPKTVTLFTKVVKDIFGYDNGREDK